MFFRQLRQFAKKKVLTIESIGDNVKKAEYAVRGDVLKKAQEIQTSLSKGQTYPFKSLTACNIGNPQFLGQKPLTWVRQGLSIVVNPQILDCPEILAYYPPDIIERGKYLLSRIQGGVGAYSDSQGLDVVRESIAKYIEDRDNIGPSNPENIFTSNGASPSVETALTVCISSTQDGVMIPIPQYPLYNALITLKKGQPIGYYMDSANGYWTMCVEEMQKSLENAKKNNINVKSVVVINPGNPTGQVLSVDNMKKIVEFCDKNGLVILADEVYQDNVYMPNKKFTSFRKIIKEMGTETELFSFQSLSKGFYGECGIRGGYMELMNIDKDVKDQILKLASIMLCSSTLGQIAMELVLNPPNPSMPSFPIFIKEKTEILSALKRKALLMHDLLNTMDNISCNYVEGAMYAMPCVKLSQKACEAAKKVGLPPDKFYVIKALEETGIILVPGSGFGQRPGTFHFRITVLSPEESFRELLLSFKKFNDNFHKQYRD
ncbi:hypothetical protein SteCoe_24142 [Stentor coeruleus]|uniref:Aminotransferase class I/classII large domain-containing protein n=1 Tax=Stentor coeruleus TaxID=5963 RepID=A0A1R2BI73_9CILI|nr:hypothetical protein SteCoe_24142 [Stentor coeruleus]